MKDIKHCHYFNNGKLCPLEEIGCQFLHVKSSECRFENCGNQLCPFTHTNKVREASEDEADDDDSVYLNENQCHLCFFFYLFNSINASL